MYQPFHKLRVRFAELEMKQGEVAKQANMAESTLTARMTGRLPWNGDEIARVAKVLCIPTGEIGTFFFEDAPKESMTRRWPTSWTPSSRFWFWLTRCKAFYPAMWTWAAATRFAAP